MTSNPPPNTSQPPQPPGTRPRQPAFAFPFLRKAQGPAGASAQFTDEHDIYRLLAQSEPSGSYLVSRKGMWHGGIHVTEAGAGRELDLDGGLRCIADGVLIAWRANRDYPVSELAADGSNMPSQAPYSTAFALVRHEMEFPRGTKLTFYSLYMHLMSSADYDSNFPKRQKPSYWSRQWQVTQYAQDRPLPGPGGQAADPSQAGLHVRKTPNGPVLGILPQGASVTISNTKKKPGGTWGQLADLNGATLYAPVAGGYVAPAVAIHGWIYLGAQNGGPVAKESIPDSIFDRVIVTTNQTCDAGDPQGTGGGIAIKAGDLIGHLGRYDSLERCTAGTRMAHIEVFCDESIKPFITAGRAWVNSNCANATQWSQQGLPADPTILRVGRGTTLYDKDPQGSTPPQRGAEARQTDVIQVATFAALQKGTGNSFQERTPGNDGQKRRWWKVDGADMLRNAFSGWVREQSFAGGRVTREFAQSWIDFECHGEDHDPAHTIFATTGDYVDYALGSDTPEAGSLGKLSPLMAAIYRALYPEGNGLRAADQLRGSGQETRGAGFPWIAFRASRLIPKHESEWANPAKWQELISAIEERTGPKPEHEEEKKRIAKLVWWDEVAAGVSGFPGADVYHINPIGLVGNFNSFNAINAEDLDYLARTLYGEARGENYESKLAVAWVIRNQVQRAHKTYKQIVTAPYQFTCWSATIDPLNYHAIQNPAGPAWTDSQHAAEEVLRASESANIIPGATNYYSPGAQAALHATNPAQYPAVPPFAVPEKRVQNPQGVSEHAYRFYRP
ncbi:cell wall hydrolase [Paraburkholderia tagetis]|uniref:Cell wall hydrolase n=1 Tax=Paraburkholderia tagetis TaxID=2913261 RepID=A0A9X1RP33_9BURK|nr:cell wall hydrolase [Paraburkholderia tagetis]MCG5074700.1 cell wall hydrolase [Paraburkholderia tagetis]